MNPEAHEKPGMIFLKGDASKFKPRPLEGEWLKQMEEYLEKLRESNPKKYEAIMKDRENARKRKIQQKPADESGQK
jgi:hypothetical protein